MTLGLKTKQRIPNLGAGRSCSVVSLQLLLLFATLISGCSFVAKKSRPDPKAQNVFCALEYRPAASGSGQDLAFLAWSSPYRDETFYMSLPDNLAHLTFAPGRHLSQDAVVEGASCSTRLWAKGFRLPRRPVSNKVLRCRRAGRDAVLFKVETKWGTCSQRIPRGDITPRQSDNPMIRQAAGLDPNHK